MVCMRDKVNGLGRMPGDAGALPECSTLGRVELELVGLPGKALAQDATRRLRFVVHAAGWLQSMVLHGHCCRYCNIRQCEGLT